MDVLQIDHTQAEVFLLNELASIEADYVIANERCDLAMQRKEEADRLAIWRAIQLERAQANIRKLVWYSGVVTALLILGGGLLAVTQ